MRPAGLIKYTVASGACAIKPVIVRSGGDLENLGGDGKYSKTIVCPDGCVIFKLTAKPLGNENFHKGGFWDYPDSTEQENK